ncbi:hypothetical protein KIW84_066082 [Lathyrus oleraceus]|uniref:Uncharacterized protein n=1 Tax=Pisum sativum TaxID=3888 RepID=A0A9D4WH63_PEA|nr:hypothetical protein KIW84_066082 [Pisum sativum]
MANAISCRIPNLTNLRRKEMKKNEVCKKRKTKVASEDNAYLQVLTIKENAQTELAKDSSTSAVTMKDSLQLKVQPYLFVPMLQCRTLSRKRWKVRRLVHKPRDGGGCSSTIRTGHSIADVQMSSAYLALNGTGNSNADIFPKVSQWISDVSDSDSAPNYEDLQSAERWLADCFKDTDMQI